MGAIDLCLDSKKKLENRAKSEWDLLITGDICPRGRFTGSSTEFENQFGKTLLRIIDDVDISIGNLEGPVSGSNVPIKKSGPSISVDGQTPYILSSIGFDGLTLANNHIMDFGKEGLERTIKTCSDANLDTYGAGRNIEEALQPIQYKIGERKIAVLNACEREFGVAKENSPGSAWISHPKFLLKVNNVSEQFDTVVVIAHGGIENSPLPPLSRQRQARDIIGAGADLVIGHHPHVPQGWERFKNGFICYSLGNFLFDRDNETGLHEKENWGLVACVSFGEEGVEALDLLPIEQVNGEVTILGEKWNSSEIKPYLERLTEITAESAVLEKYWQTIAVNRFLKYYSRHINKTCTGSFLGKARYPISRRHLWDDSREDEMLWLLNKFQNESHRNLIRTALSVLTGVEEDKRTPQVEKETNELLEWTETFRYQKLRKYL